MIVLIGIKQLIWLPFDEKVSFFNVRLAFVLCKLFELSDCNIGDGQLCAKVGGLGK